MRVACFGAIFVPISRALREHTDLDVHLYIDSENGLLRTAFRQLRENPPEWVHLDRWQPTSALLAPWTSPLIREFRQYDLVLGSELAPMFTPFAGRPTYLLPTGGDITVFPFPVRSRSMRQGLRA